MRTAHCLVMALVIGGCGGGAAGAAEAEEPGADPVEAPSEAPVCGWREGESTPCESDADCNAGEACVTGLGNEVVPPNEDGVESMPPYEREQVRYCESSECASNAPPAPASPEPSPEPEPEP